MLDIKSALLRKGVKQLPSKTTSLENDKQSFNGVSEDPEE